MPASLAVYRALSVHLDILLALRVFMAWIHSALSAKQDHIAPTPPPRPSVQQGTTAPKESQLRPSVLLWGPTAQQVPLPRPHAQRGATALPRPLLQRVLEGVTAHRARQRLFSVRLEVTVLLGCLRQRSVPLVATVLLDPVLRPSVLLDTTVALPPRKPLARLVTIAQQGL